MRWDDVAASLDTGDIMLFRDPHDLEGRAIAAVVRDPYSHVGLVIRAAHDRHYIFQATLRGVVVDPLPANLAEWPADEFGNVVVRHLRVERTPEMIHALHDFLLEVYGRPFVRNDLDMFLRWAVGNVGVDVGEKRFFCAQLVAEAWKRMGVLGLELPSNKYSERDFCQAHEDVKLLGGATLSDEIVVTLDAEEMAAARKVPLERPKPREKAPDLEIEP